MTAGQSHRRVWSIRLLLVITWNLSQNFKSEHILFAAEGVKDLFINLRRAALAPWKRCSLSYTSATGFCLHISQRGKNVKDELSPPYAVGSSCFPNVLQPSACMERSRIFTAELKRSGSAQDWLGSRRLEPEVAPFEFSSLMVRNDSLVYLLFFFNFFFSQTGTKPHLEIISTHQPASSHMWLFPLAWRGA